MTQFRFLLAEPPAKISASPDFEKALLETEATSHLNFYASLNDFAPSGWSGRTSPASCRMTEGGHLEPSSEGWGNSGMGPHTGFLTLNTTEWHSDAAVCSLSDTLETGDLPQRYYLSARACQGILRRAEKRGKALPELLRHALLQVAQAVDPREPQLDTSNPSSLQLSTDDQDEADAVNLPLLED